MSPLKLVLIIVSILIIVAAVLFFRSMGKAPAGESASSVSSSNEPALSNLQAPTSSPPVVAPPTTASPISDTTPTPAVVEPPVPVITTCPATAVFPIANVGDMSSSACPAGFRGTQTALCRADGTFGSAVTSSCVPLGTLDKLSAPTSAQAGVYSLRLASSLYTGPILDIRRSTDNVTTQVFSDKDAVYTVTGDVPLAAWLTTGTIGYVSKWYDQGAAGRHAVQTDTGLQPIFNPTLKYLDFKPNRILRLPDSTVPIGDGQYTVIVKHETIGNGNGCYLGSGSYGSTNSTNTFRRSAAGYVNYWWNYDAFIPTGYATGNVVTYTYDGSARRGYINGALSSTTASSKRASGGGSNTIGGNVSSNESLNGELYYLWIFNTSLSDADRLLVEGSG